MVSGRTLTAASSLTHYHSLCASLSRVCACLPCLPVCSSINKPVGWEQLGHHWIITTAATSHAATPVYAFLAGILRGACLERCAGYDCVSANILASMLRRRVGCQGVPDMTQPSSPSLDPYSSSPLWLQRTS